MNEKLYKLAQKFKMAQKKYRDKEFPKWAEFAGKSEVGLAINLRAPGRLEKFNEYVSETAGESYSVEENDLINGILYVDVISPSGYGERYEIYDMCANDLGYPMVTWGDYEPDR